MSTRNASTTSRTPEAPLRAMGIDVQGLTKSFGEVSVLQGVDFDVQPGKVLALLGPNGAGKTTTVRILATLLRPDAGRALVGGYDVVTQAAQARGVIGLTGQTTSVDGLLTARENLTMFGRLWRLDVREARRRAEERFDLRINVGRLRTLIEVATGVRNAALVAAE